MELKKKPGAQVTSSVPLKTMTQDVPNRVFTLLLTVGQ